ncbi:MAG: hypothetical protein ACKOJI_09270, partial [Phycisphaerales bacterium]
VDGSGAGGESLDRRNADDAQGGGRVADHDLFPREVDVHRREVADQILKADEAPPGIAGQIRPAGESG